MNKLNVLIFGHKGKYAPFLTNFFPMSEYEVRGIDRGDKCGVKLVRWADIVLFSVRPIKSIPSIMRRLITNRPDNQLWIEIASRKSEIHKLIKKHKINNVLSIHPMRRPPTSGTLKGSNIVVVMRPEPATHWYEWTESFLSALEGNITSVDAKTHEKLVVAYGQGLTHNLLWLMTAVLKQRNIKLEEIIPVSSPLFRILLSLSGRMLQGDAGLYGELQIDNEHALTMLDTLEDLLRGLKKKIARGDLSAFSQTFSSARAYIGDARLKELSVQSEQLVKVVS